MALERREYDEALARHEKEREAEGRRGQRAVVTQSALYHLQQAEVPIQQLVNQPQWDYFLSLLQHKLEAAREQLRLTQEEKVADFNPAGLAERQARMLCWEARIQALGEVMALPSEILAGAQATKPDVEAS